MLDHPDAPWQPPEVLPPVQDLRFGLSLLERQTAGVDRKHVLRGTVDGGDLPKLIDRNDASGDIF